MVRTLLGRGGEGSRKELWSLSRQGPWGGQKWIHIIYKSVFLGTMTSTLTPSYFVACFNLYLTLAALGSLNAVGK